MQLCVLCTINVIVLTVQLQNHVLSSLFYFCTILVAAGLPRFCYTVDLPIVVLIEENWK